jgi:hypothetical protein
MIKILPQDQLKLELGLELGKKKNNHKFSGHFVSLQRKSISANKL